MQEFEAASLQEKRARLTELKKKNASIELSKSERKSLQKKFRQKLVKRSALVKIAAAWIITVPVSGLMAAVLFFTIKGIMVSDLDGNQEPEKQTIEATE